MPGSAMDFGSEQSLQKIDVAGDSDGHMSGFWREYDSLEADGKIASFLLCVAFSRTYATLFLKKAAYALHATPS